MQPLSCDLSFLETFLHFNYWNEFGNEMVHCSFEIKIEKSILNHVAGPTVKTAYYHNMQGVVGAMKFTLFTLSLNIH